MSDRQIYLRTLSAVVMAPIAIAALYLGGFSFAIFALLAGTLALHEWNLLRGHAPVWVRVSEFLMFAGVLALCLGGALDYVAYLLVAGGVMSAVMRQPGASPVWWPFLGFIYIGVSAAGLVWLRESYGFDFLLWLMLIIWGMDVGAFLAGTSLQGPKLAPRISPNKTWAGLVGGILVAVLLSAAWGRYVGLGNVDMLSGAALVLAVWSQAGDLLESKAKRFFNAKDSGTLIPGHGGILDRLDSMLFTVPLVIALLLIWPDLVVPHG